MQIDALPRDWDVIIIGAGVAGALSALRLARSSLRVLLVEKACWPRAKVCGGCLNASALHALADGGVTLEEGRRYARMRLACGSRTAEFALPEGIAISRQRLDAVLVEYATRAGAWFVSGVHAALDEAHPGGRGVLLREALRRRTLSARIVLDCGGLGSRLLPGIDWRVANGARIGVGACATRVADGYRAGTIHMACARHGYVGLVRAEDDRTNIAAALDPVWCSKAGGPAGAINTILAEAGLPRIEGLGDLHWHGTPRLTCKRHALGTDRVLIVGDASGYVEPFTGEGMAWAIADAEAVVPLVRAAVSRQDDALIARWSGRHAGLLRARQTVCRGVCRLLRHPRLLATALTCIDAAPALTAPLSTWLNRDFAVPAGVEK